MKALEAMPLAAPVIALALIGCGAGGDRAQSSPRAAVTGPIASCDRPSPIAQAPGGIGPEVHGRAVRAQLWGLVMAPLPLVAGRHDVKVVWRMTGSGPLKLAEHDAHGRRIRLAWGPEEHSGSNYRRPGDEWGGGYVFRHPGCYRLTARRTTGRAEVWVRVGS